jgi:hypothetical protein
MRRRGDDQDSGRLQAGYTCCELDERIMRGGAFTIELQASVYSRGASPV